MAMAAVNIRVNWIEGMSRILGELHFVHLHLVIDKLVDVHRCLQAHNTPLSVYFTAAQRHALLARQIMQRLLCSEQHESNHAHM